jgi:DNA polymerase-1
MIDFTWKLLIFVNDFTGRGADCFYWLEDGQLSETSAEQVVGFQGVVVCHDFWIIRDILFDKTRDLPRAIIDLDEFRIAISGNPEDRLSREKVDITGELERYGASPELCSAYRRMFYKGIKFDVNVACEAAKIMTKMFNALYAEASANGELERFFTVEVPVYRLLQRAVSAGITVNSADLSEKRRKAEYDYYLCLRNYSAKHNMPPEMPNSK